MARAVDQFAIHDCRNLINSVRKQKTPVQRRDAGLIQGQEDIIQKGDRHKDGAFLAGEAAGFPQRYGGVKRLSMSMSGGRQSLPAIAVHDTATFADEEPPSA
ncbi:hypothetical protein ACEWB4_08505 [Sphingobium sp. sgz301303]|uniref:hypothetical protein n=1 Tax=Sphingobium sp. sgz301304 TaxID=3341828 RepID=UPI0035A6FEA5